MLSLVLREMGQEKSCHLWGLWLWGLKWQLWESLLSPQGWMFQFYCFVFSPRGAQYIFAQWAYKVRGSTHKSKNLEQLAELSAAFHSRPSQLHFLSAVRHLPLTQGRKWKFFPGLSLHSLTVMTRFLVWCGIHSAGVLAVSAIAGPSQPWLVMTWLKR